MLLLAAIAVGGCLSAERGAEPPDTPDTRSQEDTMPSATTRDGALPPEPLEGLERPVNDGAHLSIGVVSNGCTSADSFRVDHEVLDGAYRLTVVRLEEDLCRGMPRVVRLSIPWSPPPGGEGLPVEFANPALEPPRSLPGRRPTTD